MLFTVKLPVPVRLIVPPDRLVSSRVSVTGPVTLSVAPEATAVTCAAPPVIDPPDQVDAPVRVSRPVPVSTPAGMSRFAMFTPPPMVSVPATSFAVPAPAMSTPAFSV